MNEDSCDLIFFFQVPGFSSRANIDENLLKTFAQIVLRHDDPPFIAPGFVFPPILDFPNVIEGVTVYEGPNLYLVFNLWHLVSENEIYSVFNPRDCPGSFLKVTLFMKTPDNKMVALLPQSIWNISREVQERLSQGIYLPNKPKRRSFYDYHQSESSPITFMKEYISRCQEYGQIIPLEINRFANESDDASSQSFEVFLPKKQ